MSGTARGRVSPSREDEVVRSVSEVVGGPLGEHAGHHPWWTPVRVVLLLAALALSLGVVAKAPCLAQAGDSGDNGRYASLCWSDISSAYVDNGYAEGHWPFTDDPQTRARYAPAWVPPLPSYVAFVSQRMTNLLSGSPDLHERARVPVDEIAGQPGVVREARIFTLVNAVLLSAAGLLAAGLLTCVRRRRPWDAAAFALAPLLVLFFPITWDLLAAAAVAVALWGWSRERPALTGAAVGVGCATSPLVALLLVPALSLLLRDRRRSDAGVLAAGALGTWAALMLPAVATSPQAWLASWQGYAHGADIGSAWFLASDVAGMSPSDRTVLIGSAGMLALVATVVVGLTWRTQWSFASLSTLLVAQALIISPAAAPTFALVLLPLAVVAVREWSHLLVWQACEVGHWALLGFYLGGLLAPAGGGDTRAYWLGVVLRLAGLVWLIGATAINAGHEDSPASDPGSADLDPVERRRGEPDPHVDVLTDLGHART